MALKFAAVKSAFSNRVSLLDNLGAQPIKSYIYTVYSFYSHLGLLFWPQKLTLFHEGEIIPELIFKYGLLYLTPIALFLIFAFKKAKELFLGIGVFLIFISPSCSPIPISSLVAERYIYLPSLFLSILLAYLYQRYSGQYVRFKKYLLFTMIIIISAYGTRTVIRNRDWATPERFWAQAVAVSGNSWQAHSNMGFIYLSKGRFEEAIQEYERTTQLNYKSADLYNNLGVAYNKKGDGEKAIAAFKRALEINPGFVLAHLNLAILYSRRKEYGLAIQHADAAAKLGYNSMPQELSETLSPHRK
jgi:tetratricopeptide (TPR) repeat protein